MYGDYGGPAKYQEMVQDHGLERIVNTFHAADYDTRNYAPHLPETHENILEDFRVTHGSLVGDPAGQHHRDAGDAVLRHGADHRGQAQDHRGAVEQGRRDHRRPRREAHLPPRVLLRHPERGGHRHVLRATPIRSTSRCSSTPPSTASPAVDPVALYRRHAHRVSGFHFKDTRNVATGDDHRHRPDSEIMAPTTGKWFYEMGTPDGLVDFEAMMTRRPGRTVTAAGSPSSTTRPTSRAATTPRAPRSRAGTPPTSSSEIYREARMTSIDGPTRSTSGSPSSTTSSAASSTSGP